ncbi:AMP-binding protein [Mycobacterium sp.]|uniref:AMP-binding protein n=1 Tax=Mycobacterium sp. TaxID=1785 RepID=UPI003BB07AF6
MEQGWNFADVWESVADSHPEYLAQIGPGRRFSWAEFDHRADGVARALLDAGLGRQAKVAQYLYNCPEYLESMFGIFKAGLVPVNTNYRYTDDELFYLWHDADVEAVVFDSVFASVCDRMRHRLPGIKCWIQLVQPEGAARGPEASWALEYDTAAASACGRVEASWGRSGSDLYLLYTGGTTGMPKGVMWPQDHLFRYLESLSTRERPGVPDCEAYVRSIVKPGPKVLPAAPLMHGAGAWFAMSALCRAAAVVTLAVRSFNPAVLLSTAADERVNGVAIVGDPFGRPILDALDADPGRWDLSRLKVLVSSGTALSPHVKDRLRSHVPGLVIMESLGSSETGAIAQANSSSDGRPGGTTFVLKPGSRVIDDDGLDVAAGSGQAGRLAVSGNLPTGYFNDPVKSAESFITIDGTVYAVTGDWAEVEADGRTIKLLGRGSQCINTGGEKVFAEEVEASIKSHDDVKDAVVVGVPDDLYGQAVVAVVQVTAGSMLTEADIVAHARRELAAYKTPKRVVFVDTIERGGNGKVDPRAIREMAMLRLRNALAHD